MFSVYISRITLFAWKSFHSAQSIIVLTQFSIPTWSSEIICSWNRFCLTLSVPEKLKNSIFEMPIIPQTLNINNSTTTRTKSINPHTIRKLIEYSLKKVPIKAMFSPTIFEILMSEGRSVLSLAQQSTGSERAKMLVETLD